MSIKNDYQKLIDTRKSIEGDIDYDNNPTIKEMVDLLSDDVSQTIDYINNECTEEQFIQMSEIFDELIEKTKSYELLTSLRLAAQKYPSATQKYNIDYFIDSAEEYL